MTPPSTVGLINSCVRVCLSVSHKCLPPLTVIQRRSLRSVTWVNVQTHITYSVNQVPSWQLVHQQFPTPLCDLWLQGRFVWFVQKGQFEPRLKGHIVCTPVWVAQLEKLNSSVFSKITTPPILRIIHRPQMLFFLPYHCAEATLHLPTDKRLAY